MLLIPEARFVLPAASMAAPSRTMPLTAPWAGGTAVKLYTAPEPLKFVTVALTPERSLGAAVNPVTGSRA